MDELWRNDMNLDQALEYVLKGEALLFLGAGFSKGAINSNHEQVKDAKELSQKLFAEMGMLYDPEKSLNVISEYFQKKEGRARLLELLRDEYSIKEVTGTHKTIMKYNWKRIYTTNYDDAAEQASIENGIYRIPVTLSNKLDQTRDRREIVIHLNGFIEDMVEDTLNKEVKLTKVSYALESLEENQWAMVLKKDIEEAEVIIFIGYSLTYDIDLQRIIIKNSDNRDKIYFINGEVDEIDRVVIEQYGHIEPLYSEDLAQLLVKKEREMKSSG